jgi:hypothetical protein
MKTSSVPDELADQAHQFELVVIHFRNHLGAPKVAEACEFVLEVDGCDAHACRMDPTAGFAKIKFWRTHVGAPATVASLARSPMNNRRRR